MYRAPRKDAAFQPSTNFLIQDEERQKKEFQAVALVRAKVKRGGRAGEPGIPWSEIAGKKPQFLREDGKPLGSKEPFGPSVEVLYSAFQGMKIKRENQNDNE